MSTMQTVLGTCALVLLLGWVADAPGASNTYEYGVSGYTGQTDTYTQEVNPDNNYNNAGQLQTTRYTDANANEMMTLIAFADLGLPTDRPVVIDSATLRLYAFQVQYDADGDDQSIVEIFTLLRPWTDSQATWNTNQTGTAWATPGAKSGTGTYAFDTGFDRCSVADDQVAIPFSTFSAGYVEFDVTASLQAQVDANKFYGWVLGSNVPTNDSLVKFRDRENTGAGTNPQLVVDYRILPLGTVVTVQ